MWEYNPIPLSYLIMMKEGRDSTCVHSEARLNLTCDSCVSVLVVLN